MQVKWTKYAEDFVKQNWGKMSRAEIARNLDRTEKSVKMKAKALNLTFAEPRQAWTEEQERLLYEHWEKKTLTQLEKLLNRPVKAIKNKAERLGLRPRSEFQIQPYVVRKPGRILALAGWKGF